MLHREIITLKYLSPQIMFEYCRKKGVVVVFMTVCYPGLRRNKYANVIMYAIALSYSEEDSVDIIDILWRTSVGTVFN